MMDKDYLYQIDIREWIERGLDADIMVPVSGNKIDKKYDIYLQSFLLPLNEVENDMENDTYNAHTLMPGITVYGSWEDDEKVYHRWGNDNGYEPLVIKREYNGVATDSIEIVEEFRLLFNLYFNSQKNEYIDVSNGEGITVVKMNDNGYVTIHKRYLKTYLAVKEKVLILRTWMRKNMQKMLQNELLHTARSFFITHQFFPKKNIRNFFLKDWKRIMVTLFVRQVTLIVILQLTVRCSLSF